MTDLHSRITAALLREDQLRVCKLSDADIKFMADAVIAALKLRQESTELLTGTKLSRYVTDWDEQFALLPPEPDLSGWDSIRGPVGWAYNAIREETNDD